MASALPVSEVQDSNMPWPQSVADAEEILQKFAPISRDPGNGIRLLSPKDLDTSRGILRPAVSLSDVPDIKINKKKTRQIERNKDEILWVFYNAYRARSNVYKSELENMLKLVDLTGIQVTVIIEISFVNGAVLTLSETE
ncbi:hypothetical protein HYALB_00005502 [Hymenoscyphus albidus]|uniref:Uncharacterized protein n=1 Tax=Hymenoscyphus albidus TaxID=595503 RepID=A0A9N9QD78_9HELO|nr:hypothetical protein HYALB_00005502 [Hymenoscyphus albidus]